MNKNEPAKDKIYQKSRLSAYDKEKKVLSPPLLRANEIGGGIAPSSWINDRLPNILWGILLRVRRSEDWRQKYTEIMD